MQRIRISQLKTEIEHTEKDMLKKACKKIKVSGSDIVGYEIIKKSVDARKKDHIQYIYTVDLLLPSNVKPFLKDKDCTVVVKKHYQAPESGADARPMKHRPVIVGGGPAGLFCAYLLASHGYAPILLERGKTIEERQKDVEQFWETGKLLTDSNVQFGEGGAGTFSDGKLNTAVKDKAGRNRFVLETFVKFGAPEDILYLNKPHIGTDVLFDVIRRMREEIKRLGGTVRFQSQATDLCIENNSLQGVIINGKERLDCDTLVLACGHSARDTFETLYALGIMMEAKPFAVGFRVEHPQKMIDESQYGTGNLQKGLPVADYKVTYHASNGRSVYSFCMCPGGYVVNASSEEQRLAVNGMSYHARDSKNANSAIIMTVSPEDYPGDTPLAGMVFQRNLEKRAYELGKGKIPQQLFADFKVGKVSEGYGSFGSCQKGQTAFANLRTLLPETLNEAFCEGMHAFSEKIHGFDREDAILSGVESRTSSPVRIFRGEHLESSVSGLYPCGEGAGYAGGSTSAAMDGLKVAEEMIRNYRPAE